MTSTQNSSTGDYASTRYSHIESLAGVFHPHAMEVQDFDDYGHIVDLRSQADYENDHIPGALRFDPPRGSDVEADELWAEQFQSAISKDGNRSRLRKPMLFYCGDSGRVSRLAADVLGRRGLNIDVLPGGWINYRRWVQAGIEALPRLLAFRVISSAIGAASSQVLDALRDAGCQVLDLQKLHAGRAGSGLARSQPSSQPWFESQLLHELRGFDPGMPVWTVDAGRCGDTLRMPGALEDALGMAPIASLQVGEVERTRPEEQATTRSGTSWLLPALCVASLEPSVLAASVRRWLTRVEPRWSAT